MAEQINTQPSWLQRNRIRVAAVAASAIALVGAYSIGGKRNDTSFQAPAPIELNFTDSPPIVFENENVKEYSQNFRNDYAADGGYAAGILPPDNAAERNFATYFVNKKGLPSTDPPRLRETLFMYDNEAFSAERDKFPDQAPLIVFNATDQAVDIPFMRATAEAIRAWQKDYAHQPIKLFDSSMEATISPVLVPHVMLQVDSMPPHQGIPPAFGATLKYGNSTESWIRPEAHAKQQIPASLANEAFKNPAAFASRKTIATEMCQALTEIENVRRLIGGGYAVRALERFIGVHNPPAEHDLRLAAQEDVCNALGATLAAVYVDGMQGEASVLTHIRQYGLIQTTNYDFTTYTPMLAAFARIDQRVQDNSGWIEAVKGSSTPTTVRADSLLAP